MAPNRHLTHRHAQLILEGTKPELDPGETRLHSSDLPSLQGGKHTVNITQTLEFPDVELEDNPKIQPESQEFTVIAPQYSIPADVVQSVYPPPGEGAESRTLPHIVFRDPHLPWYNPTSRSEDRDYSRNKVPWVALLSFTEEELILDANEKQMIFPNGAQDKTQQTDTLSVKVKVGDLKQLNSCAKAMPIPDENDPVNGHTTDVVFLKRELFFKLFHPLGTLDIKFFKYLSHVRKIALEGMVSAAKAEDSAGKYAITVCHRTGTIEAEQPTPIFVHLVAIDFIADMPAGKEARIALTSLYSWTYNSFPIGAFNAYETLRYLGSNEQIAMLQPTEFASAHNTGQPSDPLEAVITKRRSDGYNIVRHRTVTGEVTTALLRSPFTPTFVEQPLSKGVSMSSNFGTDLQILDSDLSLMDITYASAWQLGRMLAMGDSAFTAALARLRSTIHSAALKNLKADVHSELGTYSSRKNVSQSRIDLVESLNHVNDRLSTRGMTASGTNRRRRPEVDDAIDASYRSPHIMWKYPAHAETASSVLASSTDGGRHNEHHCPNNTDFAHILGWVTDKLYFHAVPAHYLIPDPSYLVEESLRFFHVDWNWTDAMIDGALSLANHWANKPEDDHCRRVIKNELNNHILASDPDLKWRLQMPQYGFLMRSRLLVQFPDLAVTAKFRPKPKPQSKTPILKENPTAPILIHRRLASDTMLCLFDCTPPELQSLSFTLPAHQQFFTVGSDLTLKHLTILYKETYTNDSGTPESRRAGLGSQLFPRDSDMFDWESRTMKVTNYVEHIRQNVKDNPAMEGNFKDETSTSAVLAVQLNEPIHVLDVKVPTTTKDLPPGEARIFQLSHPHSTNASAMSPALSRALPNSKVNLMLTDPLAQPQDFTK